MRGTNDSTSRTDTDASIKRLLNIKTPNGVFTDDAKKLRRREFQLSNSRMRTIYAPALNCRFAGHASRKSPATFTREPVARRLAPARVSQSFAVQFTIFGMEETAQGDRAAATDSTRAGRLSSDARGRRLFVMRAGARLFAVYQDEVEATSETPTGPTPLPFAPAPVRGVVSQRGRILTVIDPLLLLQPDAGTPNDAPTPHAAFIVALKGDEQLALAVETVEHELELFDDETDAARDPSNNLPLRRTIRHHAGDIALLDPARLFDAAMQGVERRRRRT